MKYKITNPYRPGAGISPLYLAGRNEETEEVKNTFAALKLNIPVRSIIYSGLRGVGKTVLLNELEKKSAEVDIYTRHIEIEESKDFIPQLITCCNAYLRTYSLEEHIKTLIDKAIDAIKSLSITYNPNDTTFTLGVTERELYKSESLTQSLTDVFTSIGLIAHDSSRPICFFIDEIQYMKKEELSSLISAIHRTNQLGYPVMIIGAGLPKIYSMLAECKSYSERLFRYEELSNLSKEDTIKAIVEPIKNQDIKYSDNALSLIYKLTDGYPYFIQQFCNTLYNCSDAQNYGESEINKVIPEYRDILDSGFYKVRYDRCVRNDIDFVFAMAKCATKPCEIDEISEILRKPVSSISTTRASLIGKGIIYATQPKGLDFTVPGFDLYLKRQSDYGEWEKNREVIS